MNNKQYQLQCLILYNVPFWEKFLTMEPLFVVQMVKCDE